MPRYQTKKTPVRRLHVDYVYNKNAPAGTTQATFSPVFDQFTNNPNPLYDPSRHTADPREVSVASARKRANLPGKAARGHQKVIPPNRFTMFGGKTLIKRP